MAPRGLLHQVTDAPQLREHCYTCYNSTVPVRLHGYSDVHVLQWSFFCMFHLRQSVSLSVSHVGTIVALDSDCSEARLVVGSVVVPAKLYCRILFVEILGFGIFEFEKISRRVRPWNVWFTVQCYVMLTLSVRFIWKGSCEMSSFLRRLITSGLGRFLKHLPNTSISLTCRLKLSLPCVDEASSCAVVLRDFFWCSFNEFTSFSWCDLSRIWRYC